MVVVRVSLRLRFANVPGVQDERVFRDTMTLTDPNDRSYQDLSEIVERKLRFMDVPQCDFTVFHMESRTGDRLVVDDVYLSELMQRMLEDATTAVGILGSDESADDVVIVDKSLSLDVEVIRGRPPDSRSVDSARNILPLTSDALKAHMNNDGVQIPISALTCPPKYPNFFIRGVIIAIRFKTPKTDISVCEIDFCDTEQTHEQITGMTFDSAVQKAVKEHLRGDRKQVVELRNIYIRAKNETDRRFQTNKHPLLIRMDRGSKLEVVQILPVPLVLRNEQVVTVREHMRPTGLVNLGDLTGFRASHENALVAGGAGISKLLSIGSSSSSSAHSGARRTMFSIPSATSSVVPVSGVVPSRLGEQIKQQQVHFLSKRAREEPIPREPDTIKVTHKDVRMRDAIVAHQTIREEEQKDRIRRRKEVSQNCIICGIDCNDSNSLTIVEHLLKNSSQNKGRHIPTLKDLRVALSDRRLTKERMPRNRLVCSEQFVDLRTRTVHVVHCRCAHICAGYQTGSNLEDVVFCELPMQTCYLCGMPGASVSCYHPDCHEVYHVICALYSGGYVNFGNKDPYLPCPACPKHTQVVMTLNATTTAATINPSNGALSGDNWWEEDKVVFDSHVVEDTDLRDPDENATTHLGSRELRMSQTSTPPPPPPPPPPKGCELLRENVFESTPHADRDEIRVRRQPTMTRVRHCLIPPESAQKKYTLVLDLDETVVYAREGPLYARAYLKKLLKSIHNDFEVIVWTAGEREYAKNILEEINEDLIIKHLIYRDATWFQSEDYTKDLKQLGRNVDNVIIVENTPDCVRVNPHNGIIVGDFKVPLTLSASPTPTISQEMDVNTTDDLVTGDDAAPSITTPQSVKPKRQFTDRTLLLLQEVLLALAESGETVPKFLSECRLLVQQEAVGSDGKSIPIYYLGKRRRRGASITPQKGVRVNHDAIHPQDVDDPSLVQPRKENGLR